MWGKFFIETIIIAFYWSNCNYLLWNNIKLSDVIDMRMIDCFLSKVYKIHMHN